MANKKKRCKCCGDYGEASEGVQTPKGWFIDYSHAIKHSIELSRKRTERLRAKAVRAQAAEAKNAAREHIDNQEITVSKNIKEQEDIMPVRGRGRR